MNRRREIVLMTVAGLAATVAIGACGQAVPGRAGPGTTVSGVPAGPGSTSERGEPGEPGGTMYEVPGSEGTAANGPLSTDAPTAPQTDKEARVLEDADALRGLLDEFWTAELAQSGLGYDAPDRYEYYRTTGNSACGGKEADALPQNAYYCPVEGDEYIAFDIDWLTGYLDAHPGNATTFLILAHEWGHAVQDAWTEQQPGLDVWNPGYLQELNADCLAGVFLADAFARGTVIEEEGDAVAIYGWLYDGGSGEWFDPGDHGSPEQRQEAFDLGFNQGTAYCRQNI